MPHSPASPDENPSGPTSSEPRVLLVEDNEATSLGLARFLRFRGFEVTAVRNGASALEILATGPPPDFILTDMQLPDMDGRDVALQARGLFPRPCVVLITGWDLDDEKDAWERYGIDQVFLKPLDLQALLGLLNAPPDRPT